MADDNVRLFPVMTPAGPPADPPDNPPADPPPGPAADPPQGPSAAPAGGVLEALAPVPTPRRSPLETIAALENPALPVPIRPLPEPGVVPDTFRSASHLAEHAQAPTPGLGTLSFAAALAVVVAAMRGVHGALTGRRTGPDRADGEGQGRRGALQSAGEWGRRMLGRDRAPGGPGPRSGGAGGGPGPGPRGGRGGGWSGGGSPGGPGPRRGSSTLGADAPPRRRNSETPGPSGRDRRGGTGPDGPSPRSRDRVKDRLGAGGGRGGGGGGGRSSGSTDSTGGSLLPRRGPHRTSQSGPGAKHRKHKGALTGDNSTTAGTTGSGGSTGGASGGGGKRRMSPKGTSGPKGTLRSKKGKGGPSGSGGTGPGAAGGTAPKGKGGGTVPPTGKKRGKAGGPTGPGGTTAPTLSKPGHKEKLGPGMRHGTLEAYQDCDCRCRRCMKAYQRYRTTPPGANTLKGAVQQEFERRWAKRMRNHQPVISKLSKKQRRKAKKKGKKTGPAGTGPAASATTGRGRGPGSGPGGHNVRGWQRVYRRARAKFRARRAAHAGPGDQFWQTWRPADSGRSTPWESAGMASAGEEVITVEREDRPGDAARSRRAPAGPAAPVTTGARAVGPAPTPHTQRPGTTAPDRKEPSSMTSSSLSGRSSGAAVAGMSSEHSTEVTLDDTLEVLEQLTVESFAAHEVCTRLAEDARRIRAALEELAADLRSRHNLIGRVTAAAMDRLAEAMELVARKAEEMKVTSLNAAELSEVAEQAMFDAYRPITQATADAGLAVPSARIHNED
ncbi:hypothetical protein [Kitasatospora sp. NPDC001175]|uniref:hypothetical protein n=1 Tax=Kitasatospora sp. NPDC001175 TaxID=3157103 RepID=UPI003D073E85